MPIGIFGARLGVFGQRHAAVAFRHRLDATHEHEAARAQLTSSTCDPQCSSHVGRVESCLWIAHAIPHDMYTGS
ncbi:hypothetical protein WS83_10905 [Burkholderia sp. MSMB2042]|nr:hypothetical protein WS78_03535 [Burkholderia savannae]KVG46510.1 hypothetical protein WS77_05685 [Burkholderia sp. MSMB0265]KVG88964.1 hypothetical protein WS81_23830 [Burkholderia sp. MSMB2040]KVG93137.1 hypothetical protein WS83_10905 [Burkholderia sp. MSMB2042]KVH02273.1 hypothetical protein WS82_21395 [Burkholderia sp. MSMB2041]KVK74452.1 hypothetical protein WS91_17970 [Burkholderia sp. MSMB1498]